MSCRVLLLHIDKTWTNSLDHLQIIARGFAEEQEGFGRFSPKQGVIRHCEGVPWGTGALTHSHTFDGPRYYQPPLDAEPY